MSLKNAGSIVTSSIVRVTVRTPGSYRFSCGRCVVSLPAGTILTGVMPASAPDVVRRVWQALELSDAVGGISLGGSRAKGYATRLSDWDLYLRGEPARLMAELPGLVAP